MARLNVLSHAQKRSTAVADVQSFTVPATAVACVVAVTGNDCYATFDNGTPASTNGVKLIGGASPIFLPHSTSDAGGGTKNPLKVCATATANSDVNVIWLELLT